MTVESKLNEDIKRRYNRISSIYEQMDRMIKEEWREALLSLVSGNVLEVGIGTGANLSFYPSTISSLTGIDFSEKMLKHARNKVMRERYSFPIELMEGDIQAIPFPDDTFDSIISSCVFCSVADPIKGLQELRRVCKTTGRIYMLEHMRSDNKVVGIVMDILNPITVRLWGANINRETIKTLEFCGLKVEKDTYRMGSIFRELVVNPFKDKR